MYRCRNPRMYEFKHILRILLFLRTAFLEHEWEKNTPKQKSIFSIYLGRNAKIRIELTQYASKQKPGLKCRYLQSHNSPKY